MNRRLILALVLPAVIGITAVVGAMHAPALTRAAAGTPPPPPTFIPTPIGPPPPPPTMTPTPAPPATATATPSPTSTPLGAPARIVASARVQHLGKTAVIHWRMAFQLGIKGFRIYAGNRLLTRSIIHTHRSPKYTARVPWVRGGKYALVVLYKNGHTLRVPIR